MRAWSRPIGNGLLVGLTGYASTISLVISALAAAGAQAHQIVSALFVLGLCMGVPALLLSWRYRSPLSVGWSTAGAAVLVAHGPVHGGLRAAAGAFLLAGFLTLVAGGCKPLARVAGAVPPGIANAMLAGLLASLCMVPVLAMSHVPWLVAPIVGAWAIARVFARRWSLPAAVMAALAVSSPVAWPVGAAVGWHRPELVLLLPSIEMPAVIGLALPLFVVTMLSQNAPALGVLRDHGFETPPGPMLLYTGAASMVAALFGSFGVALAAVTAAMCAGSDSGGQSSLRWIAASVAGLCQIALGMAAGMVAPWILSLPAPVIGTIAALALLGTLLAALRRLASERTAPIAAIATFLITCAGGSAFGVGSPVWALMAGLVLHPLERRWVQARRQRQG